VLNLKNIPLYCITLLFCAMTGCTRNDTALITNVNTVTDGHDSQPGNGICEMTAGAGDCSLRAAIEETNSFSGSTRKIEIRLMPGVYQLAPEASVQAGKTGAIEVRSAAPSLNIATIRDHATILGGSGSGVLDIHTGDIHLQNVSIGGSGQYGIRVRSLAALSLRSSSVYDNQGAGIEIDQDATVLLSNTTIAANRAQGIVNRGTFEALNSTITANGTGGIVNSGSASLRATVVAKQNAGSDCESAVHSLDFNIDGDGSCGLDGANDLPNTDPLLVTDLFQEIPIYKPSALSPAVDSILPGSGPCDFAAAVLQDQRGIARPLGSACDRGAIEAGFVTAEDLQFSDSPRGKLDGGWIDCATHWPTEMAPLGVDENGALRIAAPYLPVRGPEDSEHLPAVGCAWREYSKELTADVEVEVVWTGVRPYEGTPLLHVTPDSGKLGLGAWPAHAIKKYSKVPTLLVGWIGNPPEDFNLVAGASVQFSHVEGVPRRIAIRSSGHKFTVWLSDVESGQMIPVSGPYDIPEELVGSHDHGIALDTHFSTPEWPPWRGATPPIDVVPPPDGPVVTRYRIASFREK
jgi:hypothetical protein